MRKLTTEELRLNKGDLNALKNSLRHRIILVLDNIRSTYNTGAMFRTADAAGIEAMYLCGITATPPHKGIMKVALGTTDWVAWKYFEKTADAVKELKNDGYKVAALEQTDGSIDYKKFKWNKDEKLAVIVGYEVDGISQEVIDLCDAAIDIPMHGFSHSLNVATAAGIILYEATRGYGAKSKN